MTKGFSSLGAFCLSAAKRYIRNHNMVSTDSLTIAVNTDNTLEGLFSADLSDLFINEEGIFVWSCQTTLMNRIKAIFKKHRKGVRLSKEAREKGIANPKRGGFFFPWTSIIGFRNSDTNFDYFFTSYYSEKNESLRGSLGSHKDNVMRILSSLSTAGKRRATIVAKGIEIDGPTKLYYVNGSSVIITAKDPVSGRRVSYSVSAESIDLIKIKYVDERIRIAYHRFSGIGHGHLPLDVSVNSSQFLH